MSASGFASAPEPASGFALASEPRPGYVPGPDPAADRPHMPGYGIRGPAEGSGLLPWSWAVERLRAARNF